MKSKTILLISLTILCTIVLYFVINKKDIKLVESGSNLNSVSNAVPVAPKTFQFDSSTDLKQELEKINPVLLDSDF